MWNPRAGTIAPLKAIRWPPTVPSSVAFGTHGRVVGDDRPHAHRRGAAGVGQVGAHVDVDHVESLDAAQVHLAQDAGVVPPAADVAPAAADAARGHVERRAGGCRRGRPAGWCRAAAGPSCAHLERQVAARVGTQATAVQPDGGAVVDRLEAQDPLERRARARELEVLAVPPDAAEVAARGVVGRRWRRSER